MDWPNSRPASNDNKSLAHSGTAPWWAVAHVKGRTDTTDTEVTPRAQGLLNAVAQMKGSSQFNRDTTEGASSCDSYGLWAGRTFDTNLTRQPSRPRSAPHAPEISLTSSVHPPAELSLAGWGPPSSSLLQSPALGCPKQGDSAASSFTFPQAETATSSWQVWMADWRADNKATTAAPGDHEEHLDGARTKIESLSQQVSKARAAAAAAIQQQQRDHISYQQQLAELASRHLAAEAAGNSKVELLMEQLRHLRAKNDSLHEALTAAHQAHDQEAEQARRCQGLLTEARQLAKTAVDFGDQQQQQLRAAKQQKLEIEAAAAAALAASESTVERLRQEMAELSGQLQDAVQARAAADSGLSSVSQQLATMALQLQQQQDDHQHQLDAALASNIELERQVASRNSRVIGLEADLKAAQDECKDLGAQLKQLLKDLEDYQNACQPSKQLGPLSSMRWVISQGVRSNSRAQFTAHKNLLVKVKSLVTAAAADSGAGVANAGREDDRLADGS